MSENNGKYWLGKHLSEETRRKISEGHKGKNAHNRRAILQCSLDGEIIKEWACIKDAVNSGFELSSIVLCCQGKRKTHKGFTWKYVLI